MITKEHYINRQETIDKTEQLYKKAEEEDIPRRYGERKAEEACLKIAARQTQEILKNVEDLKHYNRNGLEKQVRSISREIGEYPEQYKPEAYLEKYKTKFEQPVIEKAEQILEQSENIDELIGKKTSGKTAAAVYIASILKGNYISTNEILETADISEPTLRKIYTIMINKLELQQKFLNQHPYPKRTTWS